MKTLLKLFLLTLFLNTLWAFETQAQKSGDNKLSRAEKEEGWVLMFNGKNTRHWRGYQRQYVPGVWSASDGTLFCKGVKNDEAAHGQKGSLYMMSPSAISI